MTIQEIYDLIDGLTQDIYISYKGKHGVIVPLSRSNIRLCFDGGRSIQVDSVATAMKTPFIEGKSIVEVANEIEIE